MQSGAFFAADKPRLMTGSLQARGPRQFRPTLRALQSMPAQDIAIEGPRATCRDCAKTFVGW